MESDLRSFQRIPGRSFDCYFTAFWTFYAESMSYDYLNSDIDTSNLIDGRPVYYLVGISDRIIDHKLPKSAFSRLLIIAAEI